MTTESLSVTIEGELLTVEIGTVAAPVGGSSGSGDVVGPASATDDRIAAFDGATGKLIKQGSVTATAVASHLGSTSNPHSVTAAQAGADPTGTAAGAVSAHSGAVDPHGDRAYADGLAVNYAAAGHNHSGVYQPLATVLTNTTAAFTTAQETKLSGIESAADVTDAGNVGTAIDGATAKTTPVDADTVALIDSAASNVLKKLSWANIKATAKAYFDTLYATAAQGTDDRTASGLRSATTVVSVSAATAPSSGQVLTATSSTAATWQTPSGGAGTDTFCIRSPLQNEPPASAFATLDTRNSIPCLDFDAAADESAVFSGFAPEAIVLTSGITARIVWAATSATSGNVRWRVKFERRTTDQDSDSWDTATEATGAANGTSGICTTTEITCTTIDSIVAGDSFRVCVTRVGTDGTNDTMTGDAELFGLELRAA